MAVYMQVGILQVVVFTIGGKGFKLAATLDYHSQGEYFLSLVYGIQSTLELISSVADVTCDPHVIEGVSCLLFLDDMALITGSNDRSIVRWKLSTARAPGKTLIWAQPRERSSHRGSSR